MGADATLRFDKLNIRAEYLGRRTEFSTNDRTVFKYAVADARGDFSMKHGAYIEVEEGLTNELDLIGRLDGMYRVGNVESTSELDRRRASHQALDRAVGVQRSRRALGQEAGALDAHRARRLVLSARHAPRYWRRGGSRSSAR